MAEFKHLVGKRIEQIRKKMGITQQEVSARADLAWGYIGQIERGIKAASLKTLKRIADALGVPVTSFLGDEKDILKVSEKELATRDLLGLLRNRPKEQIKFVSNIAKVVLKELDKKKRR